MTVYLLWWSDAAARDRDLIGVYDTAEGAMVAGNLENGSTLEWNKPVHGEGFFTLTNANGLAYQVTPMPVLT